MHKTCTGIKKTKKTKTLSIYSGLGVYRSQKFWFFWFFWCLCRFCEDHALVFLVFLMPVHVWWRLESQNLHRHQKNQKKQTTRCTKPAQASKKTKKTKTLSIYSGLGVYRSQKFWFFWFFWCLCRFCEDHALVFLVFLMPVHVWWRLESQNLHRHQKKQKKQTTRCTKPAQASKKTKKTKTLSIYSGLGVYRSQKFCFFCFFWCLCRFCEDHALFFLVFLMPVQVLWRSCFLLFVFFNACACFVKVCQDEKMKKHAFHQHFRPFRCIKHCKLQCFVLIFFQKPPPHGGPLSIKNGTVND